MTGKMWGGRFEKGSDNFLEEFTASVQFDSRMFREDVEGSMAHAKMLSKQGIISAKEGKAIEKGLKEIVKEMREGKFKYDPSLEDVHSNIEKRLKEKIGDLAGKLHTGRSRNDQVATDFRLFISRATDRIVGAIESVSFTIAEKGLQYKDVIMPEYTHLQRAQPVLFAHHLMAYYEMLQRDRERYLQGKKRALVLPLGSAACTGTPFNVDREMVRKELGFEKLSDNSVDAVSDRDFALDFLYSSSILMMHLSRLADEIVLWMSSEFGFIELPDELCTGSSIMPQKKNPDMAELVRGKTGRVYGNLISLLTVMKGLPLSYNRDLQEDKEPVFDSFDTIVSALRAVDMVISSMTLNERRISESLMGGYLTATDLADYLVMKGVTFRNAHQVTGEIVKYCIEKGVEIHEMDLKDLRRFSRLIDTDVFKHLDVRRSVDSKKCKGGTNPSQVVGRIKKILRKKR